MSGSHDTNLFEYERDRDRGARLRLTMKKRPSAGAPELKVLGRVGFALDIILALTVRGPLATAGTLLGRAPEPAIPIGCSLSGGGFPQPFGPDPPSSGVTLLPELLITRQRCGEGTAARRQVCYCEIAGSQ
jgi:hypothetical protein